MIEQDTIRLLRECDAGIKMGISSIEDVLPIITDDNFRQILQENKTEHEKLQEDLQSLLQEYHDEGKDPNPMAKGMSWIKTNMELAVNDSDKTIAKLMTEGCNMGVTSLHKYLNQYQDANEKAKKLTEKISALEQKLAEDIRQYL